MKKIAFFSFIATSLFSLEIVVNTGVDGYSVLNIQDKTPFMCKKESENSYLCEFYQLPTTPVFSTKSSYFAIKPFFDKDNFYIRIKTKYHSFIKPFRKNAFEEDYKFIEKIERAKKWVIVSYKGVKLPLISQKPIRGLKIPRDMHSKPFVGAIDANGNPVDYSTQTADVVEYFKILKMYKRGVLDISRINDFLKNYPNSIFVPDVAYLKILYYDQNGDNEEVIKEANKWIKKYGSNEHLPEVILILAKNYANNADMESATYMYERLFTEYEGTKYAYKGMIYLADELYSAGDNKRAFELYKKALENTKDLEVASLAAYRLAQRYLAEGKAKDAIKYYKQVYKANKKFLLRDVKEAYQLTLDLAKNGEYETAVGLGKELLKRMNKISSSYEKLQFELVEWSYKAGKYREAMEFAKEYLKKFPYGEFADKVKDLQNKILFQIPDENASLMLTRFDKIIKKYGYKNELAQKAAISKIKLLYKLKKYDEVVNTFLDANLTLNKFKNPSIIKESGEKSIIENLQRGNCYSAIRAYKGLRLKLDKKYDEQLFKCAYKIGALDIAGQIPNKYLISDDLETRLKWLINEAKVLEARKDYEKLALIIDDICSLKKDDCYEFRYKQFFAYYHLNKPKEFLAIAAKFLDNDNIKNLDVFEKVVFYGQKTKNNLLVYTYSKKILQLQKKYNVYTLSPQINFIFANSATQLNKKQEAVEVLTQLLNSKIDDENKARAYYMLASITGQKSYLEKCIKLKNSKTWAPLCKQALEVF